MVYGALVFAWHKLTDTYITVSSVFTEWLITNKDNVRRVIQPT